MTTSITSTVYYSQTTGGFYDSSITYSSMPTDIVVIDASMIPTYQDAQAQGNTLHLVNGVVEIFTITPMIVHQQRGAASKIEQAKQQVLLNGCPFQNKYVSVDSSSRSDLGAIAQYAQMSIAGAASWTPAYQTGWIATDNSYIALPTPYDAISLATTAANWYTTIITEARTYKDQALVDLNPSTVVAAYQTAHGLPTS
jgi:hypothetical protein